MRLLTAALFLLAGFFIGFAASEEDHPPPPVNWTWDESDLPVAPRITLEPKPHG